MARKNKATKGSQTKKKKRTTQPRRQQSRRPAPPVYQGLVKDICSISNPFCDESVGSKWPDNTHFKTVTFSSLGVPQFITSNASGCGSVLFVGNPNWKVDGVVTGSSNVSTYSANNFNLMGNFPTGTNAWRITNWGLRITCTSSMQTTSGLLAIRVFSALKPSTFAVVDTTSTVADFCKDIPIARLIEKDLFIVPMPFGDMARTFQPYDSSNTLTSNMPNLAWQSVNVGVYGAGTGQQILVNAYYNFELIMNDSDTLNLQATASKTDSKILQSASSNALQSVGNAIEATANVVDNIFKSKAMKYVATLASYAYGGPAMALGTYASAKMIGDVD